MRPNDQDVAERRRRGTGRRAAAGGVRVAALTMPASEAYVSLARLATAHVGGALGLSVGRVADLKLAVDEACGQFLPGSSPYFAEVEDAAVAAATAAAITPIVPAAAPVPSDIPLELCFDRLPGKLRVTVSGPVAAVAWPDQEGLGWMVLEALVADLRCRFGPKDGIGTLTIVEPLSTDDGSRDALWFAAL